MLQIYFGAPEILSWGRQFLNFDEFSASFISNLFLNFIEE